MRLPKRSDIFDFTEVIVRISYILHISNKFGFIESCKIRVTPHFVHLNNEPSMNQYKNCDLKKLQKYKSKNSLTHHSMILIETLQLYLSI